MMKYPLLLIVLIISMFVPHANAFQADIQIAIPELNVSTYHKPYVAVWLEDTNRNGVATIALWVEKEDWFKDLRQWWRKLGKTRQGYDSVTGATRKPGQYSVRWDVTDHQGKVIPAGTYWLCFEAAREAGGREFVRQKIEISDLKSESKFQLSPQSELGDIHITLN